MIFLSSPYTSPDPSVRFYRFVQARRFTVARMIIGEHIFSPIVYCHPIAEQYELPRDFRFWSDFNHGMILQATKMYVLRIEGWKQSDGVSDEIDFAEHHGIETSYFDPVTE